MMHPALALVIGLLLALCLFVFSFGSGIQPDTGYGVGEDIGASIDYTDGGYEIVDTTCSGDDLGSSEAVYDTGGW